MQEKSRRFHPKNILTEQSSSTEIQVNFCERHFELVFFSFFYTALLCSRPGWRGLEESGMVEGDAEIGKMAESIPYPTQAHWERRNWAFPLSQGQGHLWLRWAAGQGVGGCTSTHPPLCRTSQAGKASGAILNNTDLFSTFKWYCEPFEAKRGGYFILFFFSVCVVSFFPRDSPSGWLSKILIYCRHSS